MSTSLGQAYVQIVPSAQGIKGSITKTLSGEASSAGTATGSTLATKIKGALVAAGIGATIGMVLKSAISEGGKLQQSYGGLETIYGKSAGAAKQFAAEAYKAGISANDYAEQAVSFGASLKQAFGGDGKKAVKAANTAIMDMTDNAAKMGTPIERIQDAYQGFAKQNYTMLDNLKLGYGGTKTEMQRLLADAQKLTGVEYDIDNLGDVYEAIHVIQGELGLTGVAAAEANETFTGSFEAMKAAAKNFLGALALGEDIKTPLQNMITTAGTFLFKNLLPMVGNIVKALPSVISTAIKSGMPVLMSSGKGLINGIGKGLTSNFTTILAKGREILVKLCTGFLEKLPTFIDGLTTLINRIVKFIEANLPTIQKEGTKLVKQLASGLVKNLPAIISAVGRLTKTILSAIIRLAPKLLSAGASAIKSLAKGLGGAALSAVKSAMNRIKSAMTDPINKAMNTVKGIVSKLKGIFPIHIGRIFSGLQLPRISVSGGKAPFGIGGKGSLPKFNVTWNADGAIFTRPTILQGVGEAGPEAVIPLKKFWDKMDSIAEASGASNVTIIVNGAEGQSAKEIAEEVKRALIRETKQRRLAW